MRRVWSAVVCVVCSLMLGCVATTRGTIRADRATAIQAASTTGRNLGMTVEQGPPDAHLDQDVFPFIWTRTRVSHTDLLLAGREEGYAAKGTVHLTTRGSDEVLYEGIFSSMEVHPADLGALFLELTNQQARLDAGVQSPHVNPTKSSGRFAAWNLLTPLAGMHYIGAGNPYLTRSRQQAYLESALGDAVLVGCLTAALLVDGHDTRSTLAIVGVSTGVAWRFLWLLGVNDISSYNSLARTDYDLEGALHAIEAKEDLETR